ALVRSRACHRLEVDDRALETGAEPDPRVERRRPRSIFDEPLEVPVHVRTGAKIVRRTAQVLRTRVPGDECGRQLKIPPNLKLAIERVHRKRRRWEKCRRNRWKGGGP